MMAKVATYKDRLFHFVARLFKDDETATFQEEMKQTAIAVAVMAVLYGGWMGYRGFVRRTNNRAQVALLEGLRNYEDALGWQSLADEARYKEAYEEALDLAGLDFHEGFQQTRFAKSRQIFRLMEASVLARQGDVAGAMAMLEAAVSKLSTENPFYWLFSNKLALMQMDSSEPAVREVGLAMLKALADNEKNKFKTISQFYLGDYYWANNDVAGARLAWKDLAGEAAGSTTQSQFSTIVKERLSLF